ncbi:putative cytosine permease [Estrella lausannensis]|uniref:Putative cytosine permease n=2 Tax=Estrella lausannensis TaxID=483423 RepID=A0A0H5DS68_9BACT|nr:putative cytosine permease [Estrella lausannensis]
MNYTSSWRHLAAVQIGGAVCLPIFVVGHAMAMEFGFLSALVAVVAGNGVLLLLGLSAANFAAKTRMNTTEAAAYTFGEVGRPYFALAIIISMMGWFAIQLDMMGLMAGKLLGIEATKGINLLIGSMITLAALRGYKGLETLANICLPLLIATVAYAVFDASKSPFTVTFEQEIAFGGVTVAMAAAIGAVIDMPTFFRMAKSSKDGLIAAAILFGVALPLLEGVGIYLAGHGQSENVADSLAGSSSSAVWKVWVALFILLAGWTTNNTNLYSAAISLKSLLHAQSEVKAQIALGIVGTLLSTLNLQDNLFVFLECLGVMLAAAGGVMLVNQFSYGAHSKVGNRLGLLAGVVVGSLAFFGLTLTGSSLVDALFTSGGVASFAKAYATKNRNKEMDCYEIC